MMLRLTLAVLLPLLLTLAACSPPERPPPDASLPPADAGVEPVDAGEEPVDAGEEPVDAGEDPGDAGEEPVDAGEDPGDAGQEPVDAGEEPGDAGEDPVDAGEEPVDAGEDPVDAGEDPVDAGEDPVDAGEDPATYLDTDCDGLSDLVERTTTQTDPENRDTDGDGLPDGLELGVTGPVEGTSCSVAVDADPETTTNPLARDTDGDGVEDGLEDRDGNGRVDADEFDPAVADPHPVASACAADALRSVQVAALGAQRSLAFASDAAVVQVLDGTTPRGVGALDASGTALVALELPATATSLATLDLELRPLLESVGTAQRRVERSRLLDDGTPALRLTFDATTTLDAASHANALVDALAPGTTGRLAAAAEPASKVRVEATLSLGADGSALVLVAVAPAPLTAEGALVARNFVSAATVSEAADDLQTVCERVATRPAKVDLLLVVDDSGSMTLTHTGFAAALPALAAQLDAAGVDWRMAAVTSNYHFGTRSNSGRIRGFTRNLNTARAWFTQNSVCTAGVCTGVPTTPEPASCLGGATAGANGGCWVGVSGAGAEGLLGAARKAVDDLAPATAEEETGKLRADAELYVVLLGDADDQTSGPTATSGTCGSGSLDVAGNDCEPVTNFLDYFGTAGATTVGNPTGGPVVVHGLVCPSGSFCGCTDRTKPCDANNSTREFNPQPAEGLPQLRHGAIVQATGGVLGSMVTSGDVAFGLEAIARDVVARTGRPLRFPPVAADSLRVAAGQVADSLLCDPADLPPGTVDGFEVDAEYGTLAFFGACRPEGDGEVAASYERRVAGE